MSDLQCPARFVLLHAQDGESTQVDVRLDTRTDPLTQLEDLADLHRGEALVVAVPEDAVAALPTRLRPDPGAALRVELDADGWRSYSE